jgi:hypothetical protein
MQRRSQGVRRQEGGRGREVTGGRQLETAASAAGGVSYDAVLFDTADADWLLIDSCYD